MVKENQLSAIQGGLPAEMDPESFFDANVVVDRAQDTLIPVLRLVHGTSKLVQEGKVKPGDLIDSISNEVLADQTKPVEVVPVKEADKNFSIERYNGKKWDFIRIDPYDPKLAGIESREWSEKDPETGKPVQYRRNQRLNFYVMLARDAETGKFPYMLSFQRTGYTAGKTLASFFTEQYGNFLEARQKGDKVRMLKFIPQIQIFELGVKSVQGDDGVYLVPTIKRSREATQVERDRAIYWTKQLMTQKNNYKVHDESDTETEVPTGESDQY